MKKTIAIIGGGAAGMMTAATLLERNDFSGKILLFEKNSKLGAKVIISGGGRCNVTTGVVKRNELKTYYTRGGEFLDKAFREFGPRQVRSWFEDHGVSLKQEADGRIFPVSDNGKDIVAVFEKIFTKHDQVDVRYKASVVSVEHNHEDNNFCIATALQTYTADILVLATGGNAYAHTGSSGDGYVFARSCGHTLTELGSSLNSFMTSEKWLHTLSGQSFSQTKLSVRLSSGEIKTTSGPVLLTHFGISGPATFVIASYAAFETISHDQPLTIMFQPLADRGVQERYEHIIEAEQVTPKKELHTILTQWLPKRFVITCLAELDMLATRKVSTLTKDERSRIVELFGKGIELHVIKRLPGDEFVTAGGVPLDEIDPQTMESIICPSLYFAGEIMNVDGVTGGFNLQASWSTGRLVGNNI